MLSLFQEGIDLHHPKGLKQLVQVTFTFALDWVEKGLPIILTNIGTYLRHQKEKKAASFFYTALVEFQLDYFVPLVTLMVSQCLGGGTHWFDFDYIGLALHCFMCLSISQTSALCMPRQACSSKGRNFSISSQGNLLAGDSCFNKGPTCSSSSSVAPPASQDQGILVPPSPTTLASTIVSEDTLALDSQMPSCKRQRADA